MRIEKNTIVTLRYKVADAQGKLIDASPEPMAYLHGGYDNTLPKIEFPPGVRVGGQLHGRAGDGR